MVSPDRNSRERGAAAAERVEHSASVTVQPGVEVAELGVVARASLHAATGHPLPAAAVLDSIPDGVLIVGPEGRIAQVNAALAERAGYAREELIGRPVEVLVPEPQRRMHREARERYASAPMQQQLLEGRPLALCRRDGSIITAEISLGPLRAGDDDGDVWTIAVVRDIADRAGTERRLRLVMDLLDCTSDEVMVIGLDDCGEEYANLAAHGAGLARRWIEHGSPSDEPAAAGDRVGRISLLVAAADGETPVHREVVGDDGRVRQVQMVSALRPAVDGTDTGHVIVVARDDTERTDAVAGMRTSEQLFRATFEQSPSGLCVLRVDKNGRRWVVRANEALCGMMGVASADLQGRSFDDLAPLALSAAPLHGTDADGAPDEGLRMWLSADGREVLVRTTTIDIAGLDLSQWTEGVQGGSAASDGDSVVLLHLADVTGQQVAAERRVQRARLAEVVTGCSQRVLLGESTVDTYQYLVERVAELMGAHHVAIAVPNPVTGRYRVVAGYGPLAEGMLRDELPVNQELVAAYAALDRATEFTPPTNAAALMPGGVGHTAAVPFPAWPSGRAAMSIMRAPGAPGFDESELQMLTTVAQQFALVLALGAERADRERLALLEDRHRIARDLHDTVIQELFGAGMLIEAAAGPEGACATAVHHINEAIRQLRSVVFELAPNPDRPGLAEMAGALVAQSTRVLGFAPTLTVHGPSDAVEGPVVNELLAVLREALSNIARHAGATSAWVTVLVDSARVHLTVEDDGVGISSRALRGSGLDNIKERAALLGGSADVASREPSGTRVEWSVPTGQHR